MWKRYRWSGARTAGCRFRHHPGDFPAPAEFGLGRSLVRFRFGVVSLFTLGFGNGWYLRIFDVFRRRYPDV